MATPKIEIRSVSANPAELESLLKKFSKEPGIITAFDDSYLSLARDLGVDPELVELVSFPELLGRVCIEVGLRPKAIPSRGQQRATISLACEELPEEGIFAMCKTFPGFHDRALDCLRQLHHWGMTPDDLETMADQSTGTLAQKLRELALIDRNSRASLDQIGRVPASERSRTILEAEFARPPHFNRLLVIAASDFKPLDLLAVQKLADAGVAVTVVVEISASAFEGGRLTCEFLQIPDKPKSKDTHWTEALFPGEVAKDGPGAFIFSAGDPLSECEWVLRNCQAHISTGILDHRITIFASDAATYVPLLLTAAQRLDIPVNARVLTPLLTNGFANIIRTILLALSSDSLFGLERVARSSYVASSPEHRSALRDLAKKNRLEGAIAWIRASEFADVYKDTMPWLWPILAWRERAVLTARSLSAWHEMLDDLLKLDFLEKSAQNQESRKIEHDRRGQTALLRAIADYAPVFDAHKNATLHFPEFVSLALTLWKEEQIFLPSAGRGIRVVSRASEIGQADVVAVLGMLEGRMPRRRTEDPILFDADRQAIAEMNPNMPPLPDSFYEARSQRDEFMRLCGSAKKHLILSYPQTDENRDNIKAAYLSLVEKTLGMKVAKEDYPRQHLAPPEDRCRLPIDLALRLALEQPVRESPFTLLTDPKARAAIVPDFSGEGIQPTEVGAVLECPFRAAAAYRLGLRSGSMRLEGRLQRLPLAANLPLARDPDAARFALEAETRKVDAEESFDREPWELTLFSAGASRFIKGWVDREFTARKLWEREPGSVRVQVELTDPDFRYAISVDGREIRFFTKVPAVSDIGKYRVLHLFRSGEFNFPTFDTKPVDWTEFAILAACAAKAKKPIAFEVDTTNGERFFIPLDIPSGQPALRSSGTPKLTHKSAKIPIGVLHSELIAILRRSIAIMSTGDMRATPGPVCEKCEFGELCRVSNVLTDLDELLGDPFANE